MKQVLSIGYVPSLVLTILSVSHEVRAQVAPTEVSEQAVDEFGLDRKTGRFTWSTGEIIGVGGADSRVSIAVTGVRSPPHAQSFMPAEGYYVQTNGPRLTVAPYPADSPQFPGEIDPNKNYVTVEYGAGSFTFECDPTSCAPQYFHWNSLIAQGDGYLFRDNQGVEIAFEPNQSTVTYPDGSVEEVFWNGTRKNNRGFLLKAFNGGIQAINQAFDYCDWDSANGCSSPSKSRTATLPVSLTNPLIITDAAGGMTRLRWESKTAKASRPPQGDNGQVAASIIDLTSRYPLGIKLPGSSDEDITVTYNSIDPLAETHDDIRVTSITRNGVTTTYEMTPYWPFGKATEVPPESNGGGDEIVGRYGGGRLDELAGWMDEMSGNCANVDPSTNPGTANDCAGMNDGSLAFAFAGQGSDIPPIEYDNSPPPDDSHPGYNSSTGSQIYELSIRAIIDGELVSESRALRPYSHKGFSRRRLLFTRDGLGRETKYLHSFMEEVVGVILPEGNNIAAGQDARGNISGIWRTPKPNSPELLLNTSFTYPAECTPTTMAKCNKPLTSTDADQNTTEYTYNDRGQVLTETKPAPTPGAPRPKVVNTYTMRTAYIKNSSGNPVPAGPPISLLTSSFTCISAVNCTASTSAADKVVTQFDYGPTSELNNLLLRGMTVTAANELGQIETLRTCYQYNYFGEKIAETLPRAGLASCS